MAAINISPAASPVILDNPPILGDQYLALSVLDRVANETLRVKTPFVLHYMDQLVGAMASALGSHIRLLSSRNEHPNSHGIIAKSDVNGVTWTWPNLSPRDIEFNTTKTGWDSSPYASARSNQFCAIANQGGVVHVDEKCRLQLRFSTTQLAPSYHSTPSNLDIKIPNKSALSLSAPSGTFFSWLGHWKSTSLHRNSSMNFLIRLQ